MTSRQAALAKFRAHVIDVSCNPAFEHSAWYVEYHLKIVSAIAEDCLQNHPSADGDLVRTLVWLHDYGKALAGPESTEVTLREGRRKLLEVGFDQDFVDVVISAMRLVDDHDGDLTSAPIEVQIVSSADGCSHLIGPFMFLYWYENPNQPIQALLSENLRKLTVDWEDKVTLPYLRRRFGDQHRAMLRLVKPDLATFGE